MRTRIGRLLVVLILVSAVSIQGVSVLADAPTQGESQALQATPTATTQPPPRDTVAEQQATSTPTPTPTPEPPTPTPTPTSPLPGTAHLAIQVSECVVAVGGTASSEVFALLTDVQPGVSGYRIRLRFDPGIVQVIDADDAVANGTQIAAAPFFPGAQRITENRVDNAAGEIALTVIQVDGAPVRDTTSWRKVASIVWEGRREGNSVVSVHNTSHFVGPDGQAFEPDAVTNGTVFARLPAQIQGTVRLQGRDTSSSAEVTCELAATRVDRVNARPDGRFTLTTSHGEGFYTLVASAPGYLSAEGHRPVKVTVGSTIELAEVMLYGGDATGDDRIDIRDLSFVAWHFDSGDARADLNGDGQVDILDLSLVAGNFGRVGPTEWRLGTASE
jgi:hypothetical protein